MRTTKIWHIADTHLRDSHLGSLDRGADFTAALRWIVNTAIDQEVAAIIHGGDLLNSPRPSSKNIEDLFAIHQLALEAKLPIYTVTGNHDMMSPPWSQVVAETFGRQDYGFICADYRYFTIPGSPVTVQGIPFMSREELKGKLEMAGPSDILIWHGQVKEFCGFPVEGAVEMADFDLGKFRAVLLGDIHKWDYRLLGSDNALIGYPGSTELCEKSESLEKWAAQFVIPEKGPIPLPEKITIPTRPVRPFRISTEEDLSRIIAELGQEQFEQPPILFISYNPEIPAVVTRIKNVAPANAIVRYEALPTSSAMEAVLSSSTIAGKVDAGAELKEILHTVLPPNAPGRMLAEQLLDPDVNAKEVIGNFIQSRLQTLESVQ